MTRSRIIIVMLIIGWCMVTTGLYLAHGLPEALTMGGLVIIAMTVMIGIIWSDI